MRLRKWSVRTGVFSLAAIGVLVWMWATGWFDTAVRGASTDAHETTPGLTGDLQEALQLARTAKAKLEALSGYRCIYLRDERIENELHKNYLQLSVRHAPFSVLMEWIEPRSKKGRKAAYVAGKNDGKMRVKLSRLVPAVSMDPQQSIKLKESRHTIAEAGLKNMVDRLIQAWERELKEGQTTTRYVDAEYAVTLGNKRHVYNCRVVETLHPPETKGKYDFCRTKVYFDKATGLPVHMEGYDWPSATAPEGLLLGSFTYVEVNTSDPPASDFDL